MPGYRGSRLSDAKCKQCGGALIGASSRLGREIEFDLYAANTAEAIKREAAPETPYHVDESAVRIWARCLAERAFQLWPDLRAEPKHRAFPDHTFVGGTGWL